MRLSSPSAFVLGALVLSTAQLMSAGAIQFGSGPGRTALLELYTSEGCSSCPPAEAWLSRLKKSPGLWRDFVPVAFHVDYWDYLGWKDPFASKAHSARQRAYADRWRSRSVYTPGYVLDGEEWSGWLKPGELPRGSGKPVGVLTARLEEGDRWMLRFEPVAPGPPAPFAFHAALLGFDLTSAVKAGENRGRELRHDFVALATAEVGATKDGSAVQGVLSLKSTLPVAPKRTGLAVWITPGRSTEPIQALGGWLSGSQ